MTGIKYFSGYSALSFMYASVCVEVFSQDGVTAGFLAGVLAGDHSVLEHPGALAFADM